MFYNYYLDKKDIFKLKIVLFLNKKSVCLNDIAIFYEITFFKWIILYCS